jgi:geranylgeranyl pyrophosphate synthase
MVLRSTIVLSLVGTVYYGLQTSVDIAIQSKGVGTDVHEEKATWPHLDHWDTACTNAEDAAVSQFDTNGQRKAAGRQAANDRRSINGFQSVSDCSPSIARIEELGVQ